MKHNTHGQALVEFVMILPIFIFILLAIIDFGRIMYTKSYIESKTNDALTLLENPDKNYDDIVKIINLDSSIPIKLELHYGSDLYLEVKLSSHVNIMTPGLNLILNKNHEVSTTRVVPYE